MSLSIPKDLLPAGVITIPLPAQRALCLAFWNHRREDNWFVVQTNTLTRLHQDESSYESLCKSLDIAIKEGFIRAEGRITDYLIHFRIFLVPSNLREEFVIERDRGMTHTKVQKHLASILCKIGQSLDLWNGQSLSTLTFPGCFLPGAVDQRKLSEIYADTPSPSVDKRNITVQLISRLLDFEDDLGGFGLRTRPYLYQRRSTAKMLEIELMTDPIADPAFVPLTLMDGTNVYYQPGTLEIQKHCPTVTPAKGGILSEVMGAGKTLIVLALVRLDVQRLPCSEMLDNTSSVLTPLAFKYFPSHAFNNERHKVSVRGPPEPLRVPSLFEALLHKVSSSRSTAMLYLNQAGPRAERIRQSNRIRDLATKAPQKLFLSAGTLIIVPNNILGQWSEECRKHFTDSLRVFVVQPKTALPHAQDLANLYDVVLMSYSRFRIEGTKAGTTDQRHSIIKCKCPEFQGTRIPNCRCEVRSVTPLCQIRWKRLVFDEGHVSGMSSDVTRFVDLLSVQHKWVVTGTPTKHLLGLEFGSETRARIGDDIESLNLEYPPPGSREFARAWDAGDGEDLRRLGHIVCSFIGAAPYASGKGLMKSRIQLPLMDKEGPQPGSIAALMNFMSTYIVRHRVRDIENEVKLPALSYEVVYLDLDPYAQKSYNALQSAVIVNAIETGRKGPVYLFDAKSAKHLKLAMRNLSQVLFWSVDADFQYNVAQRVATKEEYLEKANNGTYSEHDIILLKKALKHSEEAIEDECWMAMQLNHELPFRVTNLSNGDILKSWSQIADRSEKSEAFITGSQMLALRDRVEKRPSGSISELAEYGKRLKDIEIERERLYLESLNLKPSSKSSSDLNNRHLLSGALRNDLVSRASKIKQKTENQSLRKGRLSELRQAVAAAVERLRELEDDHVEDGAGTPGHVLQGDEGTDRSALQIAQSPVARLRFNGSTSSKLNYLVDQVLLHHKNEKFLIFSQSELTLFYVAEAMELCNIKYLKYSMLVDQRLREEAILTFETSETYRVFLLPVEHAARGLNLVSASRVVFCEPVWQPDTESQAIKRVHRIGQTKPVTVLTLAIRGTAEEKMIKRKDELLGNYIEGTKLPDFTEEKSMRDYIENPIFLETPREAKVKIDLPLFKLPADTSSTSGSSSSSLVPGDGCNKSAGQGGTRRARGISPEDEKPNKRIRLVRFAN